MRLLDRYATCLLRKRLGRISRLGMSALLLAVMFWSAGCKKSEAPAPTAANQPAANQQAQSQGPTLSIDDLVAPIALYPDQLLGQLLIVATNPQEVLDLGNWLITNQSMKPSDAPAAAKAAGFSTSAQYLAAFPQVVDNMCQQMDWTTQLGEAFKNNQQGVMNAIQAKRLQAQQQGNLKSSPQMTVNTASDNGKDVVQIQPANPQVVYVPQYNPETVYTQPAPAQTTTVVEQQQSGVSTGTAVAIGLLSFGVGMAVGSAFHNNDYYPYPSWGYGGMYYGGHPYYPPPYRPPYYPGYRPAGGYYPPNNYRWSNYNRNVNVQVHNNYYNRFNNNTINRAGNNGYLGNRPGNENLRGQTQYLGERNDAGRGGPPGSSMARVNPAISNNGVRNEPGRAGGGVRNENIGRGPAGSGPAGGRNAAGVADNRANSFGGNGRGGGGDRGFGGNGSAQNRGQQNRGGNQGAFGGGNSNGMSARQDSNRGRQSMGAPSGGGRPAQASHGGGGRPAPSGGGRRR